ncbi:efflux RND transporter periplasmic adaptor subunit [Thiomicrorhabdus sp. Milos-T2]|uniref:efflux RND transporter periplasmic adaptor subunit n=1 Tax=Thiomicrorhabdus sp. Milos-T2 TaxID=90814 RepID=UPI000494CAD9|nr:efflux RND transporter periplasmic adaptor subunit [Thiomicrorhabdus sp. Milos-T2]
MQTPLIIQTKSHVFVQFCHALKRSKISKLTAALVFSVSALGYIPSATASETEVFPSLTLTTEQMDALAIQTQKVARVKTYPSSAFIAKSMVPLNQRYVVTMPISGQITAIHHMHGHIDKGDVIATVYSAELQMMQSDFIATLADLKAEMAALKRAKSLSQTGAISSKKRQALEASVRKLSQMKIQQKQTLLYLGMASKLVSALENTQRIQSAEFPLISPVTGELFDIQVEIGKRVKAQAVVVSIAKTDPIVIDLEVPVKEVKGLAEGQTVSVATLEKSGKVSHISDFVTPDTQSVEVHTLFDNADFAIKPGQLFSVKFQHEDPAYKTAMNALTILNNQDIIFVQQNKEIKAVPVFVLQTSDGQLFFNPVHQEDINAQSRVITHGASSLKSNMMAEEGGE